MPGIAYKRQLCANLFISLLQSAGRYAIIYKTQPGALTPDKFIFYG